METSIKKCSFSLSHVLKMCVGVRMCVRMHNAQCLW